jgi:hypothetical protein
MFSLSKVCLRLEPGGVVGCCWLLVCVVMAGGQRTADDGFMNVLLEGDKISRPISPCRG